jgi:hypothetical protein
VAAFEADPAANEAYRSDYEKAVRLVSESQAAPRDQAARPTPR